MPRFCHSTPVAGQDEPRAVIPVDRLDIGDRPPRIVDGTHPDGIAVIGGEGGRRRRGPCRMGARLAGDRIGGEQGVGIGIETGRVCHHPVPDGQRPASPPRSARGG